MPKAPNDHRSSSPNDGDENANSEEEDVRRRRFSINRAGSINTRILLNSTLRRLGPSRTAQPIASSSRTTFQGRNTRMQPYPRQVPNASTSQQAKGKGKGKAKAEDWDGDDQGIYGRVIDIESSDSGHDDYEDEPNEDEGAMDVHTSGDDGRPPIDSESSESGHEAHNNNEPLLIAPGKVRGLWIIKTNVDGVQERVLFGCDATSPAVPDIPIPGSEESRRRSRAKQRKQQARRSSRSANAPRKRAKNQPSNDRPVEPGRTSHISRGVIEGYVAQLNAFRERAEHSPLTEAEYRQITDLMIQFDRVKTDIPWTTVSALRLPIVVRPFRRNQFYGDFQDGRARTRARTMYNYWVDIAPKGGEGGGDAEAPAPDGEDGAEGPEQNKEDEQK